MFFEVIDTRPWYRRLHLYLRWHYLRQVGPMYRVTQWWLNRRAAS